MKTIHVAAGIIRRDGDGDEVLAVQRGYGDMQGLWEFPGGKQEEGESLEQCLKREIQEELHLSITVKKYFMTSEYSYDFGTISLNAFFAESPTQEISYMDSHEEIKWVELNQLKDFDFAPADRPIVSKLQQTGLVF